MDPAWKIKPSKTKICLKYTENIAEIFKTQYRNFRSKYFKTKQHDTVSAEFLSQSFLANVNCSRTKNVFSTENCYKFWTCEGKRRKYLLVIFTDI